MAVALHFEGFIQMTEAKMTPGKTAIKGYQKYHAKFRKLGNIVTLFEQNNFSKSNDN
jgi:hypothetical protein